MEEDDWKKDTLKILDEIKDETTNKNSSGNLICLRCKKKLPKGSNICPFCGHPLNDKGRKILLDYCMSHKN